jgi:hypothetical protein
MPWCLSGARKGRANWDGRPPVAKKTPQFLPAARMRDDDEHGTASARSKLAIIITFTDC